MTIIVRGMHRPLTSLLFCLFLIACAPQPTLKGTDLGKESAPDLQLTDQGGNLVSLGDLRGKALVLTFLYTRCPDECPLIAAKLSAVADQLGDLMNQIAYIAVSVDPDNDTPIAVQRFLQAHRLDGRMRYLNGPRDRLQTVWSAYYVAALPASSTAAPMAHSSRVILIDKAGKQRVNLGSDFDLADLVYDLRNLARE